MGNEINKETGKTYEIRPIFNNTKRYINSNEYRKYYFELHCEEILRKQRIRYHQNKEKVRDYARNYYHQK